jgi:hypothetical protein
MEYKVQSILGTGISLVLLLVMASCNSDQFSSSVAQIDEYHVVETPGASDGSAETKDLTDEEITARFSTCMRDHGFKTADPTLNADGTVALAALKLSMTADPKYDPKDKTTTNALDDCVPLLTGATFTKEASPGNEIEGQDNLLTFAQCLRDDGLTVSDPDFSGDGQFSKDFINDIKGADSRVQNSIDLCSKRIFGSSGSGK